jgi:uncharacterized protein HemX
MSEEMTRADLDRKERTRFVTTWAGLVLSVLVMGGGGLVAWGKVQVQLETITSDMRDLKNGRERMTRMETQVEYLDSRRADVAREIDRLEQRFDTFDAKLDRLLTGRARGAQ